MIGAPNLPNLIRMRLVHDLLPRASTHLKQSIPKNTNTHVPWFYDNDTLGVWKKTETAAYLQFVQDIAPQSVIHARGLHRGAQGGPFIGNAMVFQIGHKTLSVDR
jgi:hypothetical protein